MGIIEVQLPEQLQHAIERQVAQGRAASQSAFLVEAARRLAEELELDDEIVAGAIAGIADAESGRFVTLSSAADADALHERTMARLQDRLISHQE